MVQAVVIDLVVGTTSVIIIVPVNEFTPEEGIVSVVVLIVAEPIAVTSIVGEDISFKMEVDFETGLEVKVFKVLKDINADE
jgi:hypothetical protein